MNDKFFITGGTLPPDSDSYIVRHADEELLDGLRRGEFCYVLNTRQMGKSSLMARAARQLKQEGVRVVILDLTAIGQNLTVEQWYAGLLARVGRQTGQKDALLDVWRASRELGPMQRFLETLRYVLLAPPPDPPAVHEAGDLAAGQPAQADALPAAAQNMSRAFDALPLPAPETLCSRLVIFVDEIDAVRSLPFSADEFFAGIRECCNRRAHDPAFQRLTFCLLGVATPSDLIQDTRISPFNIGRRIELRDFTPDEAAPLAQGLNHPQAWRLLQRVLYWTGGHPYLTQRLCRAVMEELAQRQTPHTDELEDMALIDRECERLFLSKAAQETDDNLTFVRSRLLRGETDVAALLDMYLQILKGRRVRDDETNPLCGVLRLSGITTAQRGLLRPRNRIYDRVFDREWALAHLPDAEMRRQKQAYRRGVLRAGGVFSGVAFVGTLLLAAAVVNARHARDSAARARSAEERAETQGQRADAQAEEARRLLYFSDLRLIQSEWDNSNLGHVQTLLDETRRLPQRGWEWDYWNRLTHRPTQTIALGNKPSLVQFSPDSHLEIAGDSIPLTVYDLRTGAKHTYGGVKWTGGQPVDYAPDGSRLWTCTADGAIRDALTGRIFARPAPKMPYFATVCALRDGSGLLTCDNDGMLCLWNLATGGRVWQRTSNSPLKTKPLVVGSTLALAFDTQGKRHLYRLRDGVENHAFDEVLQAFVPGALAFSSDDALLAGEGRNGGIVVLDLHTGRIMLPLGAGHTLTAIRFGPNDKNLIAAFWGSIQVWDWRANRERSVLKVNWAAPDSYAISPNGRYAAIGEGYTEKVWDLAAPGEPRILNASPRALWRTSYSPDGGTVAAGGDDGNVYRYETRTGLGLPVLRGDGVRISAVSASHNGRWIAAARADGGVWVWDAQSGRRLAAFRAHAKMTEAVCFSRDDRTLLTASDDCLAKLWDVGAEEETNRETNKATNKETNKATNGSTDLETSGRGDVWHCRLRLTLRGHGLEAPLRDMGIETAVFSPDETRVLTGSDDHTAKLWDARTGAVLDTFPMPGEVWGAAFSPDGRRIALALLNNTAEVWDIAAHRRVLVLQGHTNWLIDVAFSPDGRRIVTGSKDGIARLWDAQSGRELLALKGHEGQINGVAFSPGGDQIATSGRDGAMRLWNAAPLPDTPAP